MMHVYGGYAAVLRGLEWPREPSDIDIFGSADDLEIILEAARVRLPFVPCQETGVGRYFISVPTYQRPSWWRNIEFVIPTPRLTAALEALPDNVDAQMIFRKCKALSLTSICCIKVAAIRAALTVNPKHAQDLAMLGWRESDCLPEHLELIDAFSAHLRTMAQEEQ